MQPTTTRAAERAASRPRRRIRWGQVATIAGFLLPAALVYTGLVLFPIVQAAYYSLFRWNGLGPLQNFIGAANYARILGDRVFLGALGNNLKIVAMPLVIQLALALALLIRHARRGQALFRTVFFLPFVLSEVVTGVIWSFIFRPQGGLINLVLERIAPSIGETALLADPATVLYALFAVITWKFFGYHMILYIAGLQKIPPELEEAAQIDGCSPLQALRFITLPLLGPTIRPKAIPQSAQRQ